MWLGWDGRTPRQPTQMWQSQCWFCSQTLHAPCLLPRARLLLSSLLPQEHIIAPTDCAPGSPPPSWQFGWFPAAPTSQPSSLMAISLVSRFKANVYAIAPESHERVNVFTPVMRPSGEFLWAINYTCPHWKELPQRAASPATELLADQDGMAVRLW